MRNLKVLDRLFYRPMMEMALANGGFAAGAHHLAHLSRDFVERLFPNLEDLLDWHSNINDKMKERLKGGFPIDSIRDILDDMVRPILLLNFTPLEIPLFLATCSDFHFAELLLQFVFLPPCQSLVREEEASSCFSFSDTKLPRRLSGMERERRSPQ